MDEKHAPDSGARTGDAPTTEPVEYCSACDRHHTVVTVPARICVYECRSCSAKSGAPTLCGPCLEARRNAGRLWRGPLPRSGEALPPGITPVEYVDREELLARYAKPKCETTEGHSCAYETVDHPPRRERATPPWPETNYTRDEANVVSRICILLSKVWEHFDPHAHDSNDCFCKDRRMHPASFRHSQQSIAWLEKLVERELALESSGGGEKGFV